MNYLFGVDGGGSGCRVVLTSTDGKILGKAKGGPANIETSFSDARDNIINACVTAFKIANLISSNENKVREQLWNTAQAGKKQSNWKDNRG